MASKLLFILTFINISLFFPFSTFAQSPKEAVLALKKLQARVETGVSYRDYSPAVSEAKFAVKLYLDSPESKDEPDLSTSLLKTIEHYQIANDLWGEKFSGRKPSDFVTPRVKQAVFKIYPDAPDLGVATQYSHLLSFIWGKASLELNTANSLLSKTEAKAENAKLQLEALNKENEAFKKELGTLKIENSKLKEENEALKAEVKTLQSNPRSSIKKKK
jgi:cell division protein FtsB